MRLLTRTDDGRISLTRDLSYDERPPYAILSHTWAENDNEEVIFAEVEMAEAKNKPGYQKILFCAERAKRDGLNHFWIDTCCIDRTNHDELSEAITSMFRWYQESVKCYVYLSDVSYQKRKREEDGDGDSDSDDEKIALTSNTVWLPTFRTSRWFRRGWTLQELLAPKVIEFFSRDGAFLGDKTLLIYVIQGIIWIPVEALRDTPLSEFPIIERLKWIEKRQTKRPEDRAYCLFGILDVSVPIMYGEGEEQAFRRLQRAIQDLSVTSAESTETHWMVPGAVNPLFTGRQDLLRELGDTVRNVVYYPRDRPQCRIVICGPGGQGKSEICLQLAERLRQLFWAVIWIDATSQDTAGRSLIEAARRMAPPLRDWHLMVDTPTTDDGTPTDDRISVDSLTDALYIIADLKQPWLLILDNANEPEVNYMNYIPDCRHGVILLTTRDHNCGQYNPEKTVTLNGLSMSEAQELLFRVTHTSPSHGNEYSHDTGQVAVLLQYNPLALFQAGTCVARGHCTLADYPNVYQKQRTQLQFSNHTLAQSDYCQIYTAFEISAHVLTGMDTLASQDALQLLGMLAVCRPTKFPLWVFKKTWQASQEVLSDIDTDAEDGTKTVLAPWHVDQLPAMCGIACKTWDPSRLVDAVNLLKAFYFVSTDAQDDTAHISSHSIVYTWARDRQNKQQQDRAWLQMGCLIAFALKQGELPLDHEQELEPHIESLIDSPFDDILSSGPTVLIARILVYCGYFMLARHVDAKLSEFLPRVFAALKLDMLKAEQQWADLYYLTAQNFRDLHKTTEAVTLFEQVLNLDKRTLLADEYIRLNSHYELADAYTANGQIEKATDLLEDLIKTQKEMLGPDDPVVLASQNNLAVNLSYRHKYKAAFDLMTHVVDGQKRVLEQDDPNLKNSMRWLRRMQRDCEIHGSLDL